MVLQSCPALRQWGQAFLFPILKDQSLDRCSSGDSMQCWVILSGCEWVPSWDSALNHQPPTLSAAGASASHTTVSTALPNTTYLKSRAFSTVSSELEFLGKDIYAACTVHKIKFPLSYDFVKLDVQDWKYSYIDSRRYSTLLFSSAKITTAEARLCVPQSLLA